MPMGYTVIIKKFNDADTTELYTKEEWIIEFLKNLRKYKYSSIQGKSISDNIDNISVFQILETNFDWKDTKWGYYITLETKEWWEEVIDLRDFEEDFAPSYKDITTEMVVEYYQWKKVAKIIRNDIEEIDYNINTRQLIVGGQTTRIKWSKYGDIIHEVLRSPKKIRNLSELSEWHHWVPDIKLRFDNQDTQDYIDSQARKKVIRNALEYLNRRGTEQMWDKKILELDWDWNIKFNVKIKLIKE